MGEANAAAGRDRRLLLPGDAGYDDSRRVFNHAIDRHPAAVVRCASAGDVAWGLRYARERGLPLAVRGAGHNLAGYGVVDGGVQLDLRGINHLRVDRARRTATVGPGLTWGQVDAATQAHGLATTGGNFSTVGVSGYTLGGGFGKLMLQHGMAVDNLLAAEVVTADGEIVTASGDNHPDLYWALRGGGGNFGVVTSLTYRLHAVREVLTSTMVYPVEQAAEVVTELRDHATELLGPLAYDTVFMIAPPAEPFPPALHGKPAVVAHLHYFGPHADGERAFARLRPGKPLVSHTAPTTYVELQQALDAGGPQGLRWDGRGEWLRVIDDRLADLLAEALRDATTPLTQIYLARMGGKVAQIPDASTAFSFRHAAAIFEVITGVLPTEPSAEPHYAWNRELFTKVAEGWSAGGGSINHIGIGDGPERVRAAYPTPKWQRLTAIKRRYDPDNLFRSTANIPPTG